MRAHSSASFNGAALNGAWIRKASWLAIMALMAVTLVIGVGQPAQGGLPGETTTMPPVE